MELIGNMAERKKTTRKTRKKKGFDTTKLLPKMEVLFVVVLFLCFFAWALAKCSTTPSQNVVADDMEDIISPAAADNPDSPSYDLGEEEDEPDPTLIPPEPTGNVEVVDRNDGMSRKSYTPLFVTLQDLKIRKGPSRDSAIVTILNLHEEVMFLEKRTNFREKISNGAEIMDEPWIYVQSKKGHKGWVYGGGVHFFKWDRLKNPIPSLPDEEEDGE